MPRVGAADPRDLRAPVLYAVDVYARVANDGVIIPVETMAGALAIVEPGLAGRFDRPGASSALDTAVRAARRGRGRPRNGERAPTTKYEAAAALCRSLGLATSARTIEREWPRRLA